MRSNNNTDAGSGCAVIFIIVVLGILAISLSWTLADESNTRCVAIGEASGLNVKYTEHVLGCEVEVEPDVWMDSDVAPYYLLGK